MRDPSPQHHFWRLSTYSEKQQRQQCAGAHCSVPRTDQALPKGRPPEPRELLVTKDMEGAGGQPGKHRNWKPTEQRHHQHWAHWQEGTRQQTVRSPLAKTWAGNGEIPFLPFSGPHPRSRWDSTPTSRKPSPTTPSPPLAGQELPLS